MKRVLVKLWRDNGSLLILLGIVSATGVINLTMAQQRAFLNLYYLPVILGAYRLGRRHGVYSAMMSCLIVFMIALVDGRRFGSEAENWMRWLDLATWGCFLILTSYVVGTLYDLKEAQVRDLNHAYQGILEIMSKFIDTIDRATENHSRRVAEYSVEIARALRLGPREIEYIRVGALLHDIGKIEISTEVLLKATALDAHELAEMRRHVDSGEQMLSSVGGILRDAVPMVAFHHERWDGKGYKGLAGRAIPLGARIIAITDAYDAMTSDRPYRKSMTHDEALAAIQEESGKQFDPQIVSVFLATFARSPQVAREQKAA
jgi:putative nucleotidyltransferase with HDIG domain